MQIAEKLNKKPDEFINKFEEHFKNVPYDEKGYSISNIGVTLYNFSYFNLALASWEHALKYFIKNDDQYGESSCYGNVGAVYSDFGE